MQTARGEGLAEFRCYKRQIGNWRLLAGVRGPLRDLIEHPINIATSHFPSPKVNVHLY